MTDNEPEGEARTGIKSLWTISWHGKGTERVKV